MKYKLNVAMRVTKEQFENDLKEPLIQIGKFDGTWGSWDEDHYVRVDTNTRIGNYSTKSDATFIDHYNPQLFLALAAMTDKEDGNVGEYWKCIGNMHSENFIVGDLYKQVKKSIDDIKCFIDKDGDTNGFFGDNMDKFVKATKEEIFAHFNKTNIDKNVTTSYHEFRVGDSVRVKEYARFTTVWASSVWQNSPFYQHFGRGRGIQQIYKIEGDLIHIDNKDYSGGNYIIVERENIELVESKITEIKMKNRILTPENATKIINIACSTWKPKLAEKWATNIVLNKNTEISELFYIEMRNACTAEQNILFNEIFGKDEKLIDISELEIGESMEVYESNISRFNGIIVTRIYSDGDTVLYVNFNNPRETWSPNPKFKGKRVKLTITHEEIK